MNKFIETVRNDLEVMMRIRQEYIECEDELLHNSDDTSIHNRIFEIYSKDVPEILVHILFKLRLSDEDEAYGQHTVSSVFKNFWRHKAIDEILDGYNTYYKSEKVQILVDELDRLTKEMQGCLSNLQAVVN
jgi:hypothetical protein